MQAGQLQPVHTIMFIWNNRSLTGVVALEVWTKEE